ncbi:hypothetical protein AB1J28_04445 [Lysinibacillus irui]|uniref:hypothetical protein n=1 Tax=Lysinibacillus irui TaxID=2998077 RepID=UPI003D2BA5BE
MERKQKKWWQRSLALMLSLVLVISSFLAGGMPVSYAAEEGAPLEVYVGDIGDKPAEGTLGSRGNPYATLSEAYNAVAKAQVQEGTIYIMDDITLPPPLDFSAGKKITITTDPIALVDKRVAVIHRGSSSGSQTLFGLTSGQLTLKNIIIDGGRKQTDGRIFNIGSQGKLIIEEGAILRNNYSSLPASAILLQYSGAIVEMTGGEISGNNQSDSGAVGVNVSGATFKMTGGKITDNSGGGVYVVDNGKLSLSGNAVITGNTSGASELNVDLRGNNSRLVLDGDFTGKAGITAQNRMTAGKQFGEATASGLTGLQNLIADNNPHLYAAYGEGNNDLVWKSQVAPGGLTDGLVLWLRPDAGINVESGASVSSWEDQSRSANHASQSAGTSQPKYWDEPNHNVNFNPMLDFDGNDFLVLDDKKLPLGKDPRTIVSVAATEVTSGNHYIISWGTANWYQMMGMLQKDTTGSLTAYSNEFTSDKNFWTVGVPNELFGTYDGSTGALYSKMNQIGNASRNWDTLSGSARIGNIVGNNSEYWNGTIGDLIVFNRVLDDTERQRISTYLSLKYGYTLENTDYLDTNGTTVWNATENSNYNRNIAGIANDTNGALLQKQSHSTNTGIK